MSMTLDPPGRPHRGRPLARNEILRAGRLAGLDPRELADRFGTPLYVYDLGVIGRQVAALRAELPDRVDLAYAVKANPALAIIAYLGTLGLGADVASGGELATALRAGIPADRIVVTGPGKRDDELRAAVRAGIRAVTVESLGELGRLERVARNEDRRQPVLLRAAVTEGARLERVRLVGDDGAGKFGMDAADLMDAARLAARSEHLELLGLHAFGASNVLDASALVAHAATTAHAARELARLSGITVRIVDAGGGLGIPYEPHEESLDLVRVGGGLAAIVDGL
jgi:diaminopimelate decarboxylase